MPTDFSADGAFGAGGGGSGTFGAQTGGTSVSDPGPGGGGLPSGWNQTEIDDVAGMAGKNGQGPNPYVGDASAPSGFDPAQEASAMGNGYNAADLTWNSELGGYLNSGAAPQGVNPAFSFADGGAIDDGSGSSGDQLGNSIQASINQALGTVDSVLQFGRKLHGLGGGDDSDSDGAIPGQQASMGYQNGRMPAVPGNASDSGVKPIQPMPGPLPPASNPFGKRADAGDTSGAIDTGDDESDQGSA